MTRLPLEFLLAVPLLILLGLPVYWSWRLAALYFCAARRSESQQVTWPRAAVVLPLRGADPFLADCVAGILTQDYPSFELHIVVDSREDPAWDAVAAILNAIADSSISVRIQALHSHRESCSLKVSAQLQALESLDPDIEVVALIDADVVPGPTWLRSLVRPLLDPRVGASTGFRWYAPRAPTWGSLVRYIWNAAACTQMHAFSIPWGGSLALHERVFRHPDLLSHWQECFGEDTRTYAVLRKLGLELRFVGAATTINTETTDLTGCCTFIRRQLFSARVNHSLWPSLLAANLAIGLALPASVALAALAALRENWQLCIAAGALPVVYGVGLIGSLAVVELLVRALVRQQGSPAPPGPFSMRLLPAALLTQLIYFGCLLSALRLRRIDWRGITYSVDRSGKLRLLEYRPYGLPTTPSQQGASVL